MDKSKLKLLKGTVLRNSSDKTLVVKTEKFIKHSVYGKYIKQSKSYMVHNDQHTVEIGDLVNIVACRPYSKRKKFRLVNIIKKRRTHDTTGNEIRCSR